MHGVCKHMPKSVRPDCDQFVEKYADLVISLLAQELNPDEVCRELKLCGATLDTLRGSLCFSFTLYPARSRLGKGKGKELKQLRFPLSTEL